MKVAEKFGGGRDERVDIRVREEFRALERHEQLSHLPFDIFGEAEQAPTLPRPDRPIIAGPWVYVLEQMPVQFAIVCRIEFAGRGRLEAAGADRLDLERFERSGGAQIGQVLEDIAPRITGGVLAGVIGIADHQAASEVRRPSGRASRSRASSESSNPSTALIAS